MRDVKKQKKVANKRRVISAGQGRKGNSNQKVVKNSSLVYQDRSVERPSKKKVEEPNLDAKSDYIQKIIEKAGEEIRASQESQLSKKEEENGEIYPQIIDNGNAADTVLILHDTSPKIQHRNPVRELHERYASENTLLNES